MSQAYVYIFASKRNGTLYIGVTTQLVPRLEQHRSAAVKSFSSRYHTFRCVHVEVFESLLEARTRERRLKNWHRRWKLELIETHNPYWRDLSTETPTF